MTFLVSDENRPYKPPLADPAKKVLNGGARSLHHDVVDLNLPIAISRLEIKSEMQTTRKTHGRESETVHDQM